MPTFEVTLPPTESEGGLTIAVRIEAETGMGALRSALTRLGDPADTSGIAQCDIQADGTMRVTTPRSGRVFRIREVGGAALAAPPPMTRADAIAAARARVNPNLAKTVRDRGLAKQLKEELARRAVAAAGAARVGAGGAPTLEDVLAEVFERAQHVYEKPSQVEGLGYLLDLALGKVPADAGAALLADISQHDLYFGAARGPKAADVRGLRVPMGSGIVGFCAREGVAMAVSDAERDRRFVSTISERIGVATRSVACAPMLLDGRVLGCLELINRVGADAFGESDLSVLCYLAGQAASYVAGSFD